MTSLPWAGGAALCASIALGAAGCAAGNVHDYRTVHLPPPLEGSGKIAIAVHDQRPEVLNGAEDPDWVGIQRGGLGNPFAVTTESGLPLADDWAHVVGDAMKRGGFAPIVIRTAPGETDVEVVGRMRATGAQALMLFIVHDWHADTFNNVTLHHDVVLAVLDSNGAVLGEARSGGPSELGGDSLDAPSYAKKTVPDEFEKKLEWMLGDEKIVRAVTTATKRGHAGGRPGPG